MLSQQLKEETHKAHIDVEKLILRRIRQLDSNYSYSRLLKLFYGYFNPLEEKIDDFVTRDVLADIKERRKSDAILRDLQAIDASETTAVLCEDTPAISNLREAIGAMYVLEGSTLGGIHLSKMISEKINLPSQLGIEFFSGYGPDTFVKWSLFKEHLNQYTDTPLQKEIIDSANETFGKFKKWIEAN